MALGVDVRGEGPPLVLLHGFTQTARLWGPVGNVLAETFTIVAIDLPGHGGSADVRADLVETAQLVAETVHATIGSDDCCVVGYSLGARVALHVLAAEELAVRRAVVIGATGGMEDAEARRRRRELDEGLADSLEDSGDVEGFVDRWLSGPMFAQLGDVAQREERLRNTASGLASSLRMAGTGAQEPLWDRLHGVDVPLLALAGSNDDRFVAHALRLASVMRAAVATLIPGGGHAVHLSQPATVSRLVRHFLQGPEALTVAGEASRW